MNELEYRKELAKIVLLFSTEIVDIVEERIKTFSRENYVCEVCGLGNPE